MEAIHVIRKPLLTEKGAAQAEHNRYVFEVDKRARKDEIKRAIQEIYGVRVVAVNTSIHQAGQRRTRWGIVPGKLTKKASVRLHEDDTIELF
ncbi:MAG: 50S ribosomal protein L23 [Phycisphaerales bacterium]|nr:MAG: 50S ribosomal protein L23 [Phycisphaerales bacterium]